MYLPGVFPAPQTLFVNNTCPNWYIRNRFAWYCKICRGIRAADVQMFVRYIFVRCIRMFAKHTLSWILGDIIIKGLRVGKAKPSRVGFGFTIPAIFPVDRGGPGLGNRRDIPAIDGAIPNLSIWSFYIKVVICVI